MHNKRYLSVFISIAVLLGGLFLSVDAQETDIVYLPIVLNSGVNTPGETSTVTSTPTTTPTSTPTLTSTPTATAINTTIPTPSSSSLSGYVQKGPFIQGTEIIVRELNDSFIPTGRTFAGMIDDNTGSFVVSGELAYPYVELSANGFYFNEVTGALSNAPINLLALVDVRESTSINVNLLTHLERRRVSYLLEQSLTFRQAKLQAQKEILGVFNVQNVEIGNSEALDISKVGDGNAILLAISVILQSNNSEAQLTELLSIIGGDLRTDGSIDSETVKKTLLVAMEYVKPRRVQIREHIAERYTLLGVEANIPAFEDYLLRLDTESPTVSFTEPEAGADLDVAHVMVTFSELMDHNSLSGSAISLEDAGGIPVVGTLEVADIEESVVLQAEGNSSNVSFHTTETSIPKFAVIPISPVTAMPDINATTVITFMPVSPLPAGIYTLTVDIAVKDVAGNPMSTPFHMTFVHTPDPAKRFPLFYQSTATSGKITNAFFQPWSVTPADILISGQLVYGNEDGSNLNGCVPYTDDMTGKVVLADRGVCGFTLKASNASQAGATISLIASPAYPFVGGDGGDRPIDIPVFMLDPLTSDLLKREIINSVIVGYDPNN